MAIFSDGIKPHTPCEGEALRFSLTSLSPLPRALVDHCARVFREACADSATGNGPANVVTTKPRIAGLDSVSFFSETGADAAPEIRDELRGPAIALGVDCALTTGRLASHGPSLVVTDVDSTFIRGEVIEMLSAYAGTEDLVAEITASAMRGELDFAESLVRRVATLAGVSERAAREIADSLELTPGAERLVHTLHAHGAHIGLVSGGFHEVVDIVAERVGVDRVLANHLEVKGGKFTGRVSGKIVERTTKAEALGAWAAEFSTEPAHSIAVGDGANDLDMMEAAGLSVAFCAKPVVLERADAAITRPRLDEVLAFVGWDAA